MLIIGSFRAVLDRIWAKMDKNAAKNEDFAQKCTIIVQKKRDFFRDKIAVITKIPVIQKKG